MSLGVRLVQNLPLSIDLGFSYVSATRLGLCPLDIEDMDSLTSTSVSYTSETSRNSHVPRLVLSLRCNLNVIINPISIGAR